MTVAPFPPPNPADPFGLTTTIVQTSPFSWRYAEKWDPTIWTEYMRAEVDRCTPHDRRIFLIVGVSPEHEREGCCNHSVGLAVHVDMPWDYCK